MEEGLEKEDWYCITLASGLIKTLDFQTCVDDNGRTRLCTMRYARVLEGVDCGTNILCYYPL